MHATCRYFLRDFGAGAHAHGGLVAADHSGGDDQRPDRHVRRGHRLGGALQQAVHPPVAGAGPGHRLDDIRAPLDRDVVHHHQEHAPGLEVQPVGDRARRARRFRGRARHVHPAAPAPGFMPVVLDGQRPRIRQVGDLVRIPHPQVSGAGQARAARAPTLREMIDDLVRVLAPGQVRTRRARLLAGLAATSAAGLRSGGFLPGRSSVLGGIDEFPELREINRSSRAIRSSRSAIFASLASSSIRSRSFASRSRPFSARSASASWGTPGPGAHQHRPAVIAQPQ